MGKIIRISAFKLGLISQKNIPLLCIKDTFYPKIDSKNRFQYVDQKQQRVYSHTRFIQLGKIMNLMYNGIVHTTSTAAIYTTRKINKSRKSLTWPVLNADTDPKCVKLPVE